MSDNVYDILKRVVQIILPACAGLYAALSEFWNLPYPTEVAGTIAAVVAFLSACLGFSDSLYSTKLTKADEDLEPEEEEL